MEYKSPILAAALLYSIPVAAQQKDKTEKPEEERLNIIHIMTDDHSYQTISAYGHPVSKLAPTPNIDHLASEGVTFQKAFVENSISTPSRACLMTGLYSHQNGQRKLGKGIDTTKVFFTELLQANGYQTAVVGKWHMQCEPKGFDHYCVLYDQGHYYNPEFRTKATNGKYIREEGYATALITDHSIEFLEQRDKSKPFCLLVHHKAPHRNWMPEEKYIGLYEDITFPTPETFWDDYETRCSPLRAQTMSIANDMMLIYDLKLDELKNIEPYKNEKHIALWQSFVGRMTPEQRKAWDNGYAANNKQFVDNPPQGKELTEWKYQRYMKDYLRCIKSVDDEVGRLIAYLEQEGLLENTIIVYTSDQGHYMGEHGLYDKRFMYEESFRTPLIIRYPQKIKQAISCEALVQNIDFAPTFLDVAGIEKPEYMEGTSLIPLFGGTTPEGWRTYLYYHYYDYPGSPEARKHDGVRDSRYKLIHYYSEGYGKDAGDTLNCNELYDLQTDPYEVNNLYGKKEYKEVTERLQKRLDKFREDLHIDEF